MIRLKKNNNKINCWYKIEMIKIYNIIKIFNKNYNFKFRKAYLFIIVKIIN